MPTFSVVMGFSAPHLASEQFDEVLDGESSLADDRADEAPRQVTRVHGHRGPARRIILVNE